MKVTLLGTGSSTGTPQLTCDCPVCTSDDWRNKRTRFAIMVETEFKNILVDIPFEIRQQLLKAKVDKLDAIWLTHAHSDHFAGVDDVRMFSFRNGKPLPIFSDKDVIKVVEERYPYLFFENEYVKRPILKPYRIEGETVFFHGVEIVPIRHKHGDETVTSFRIGEFAFLADFSTISEKEREKLTNLKLLVVSSTLKSDHHKHMKFSDVVELIEGLKPERAVLTHMNHRFDFEETKKSLPAFIEPGYDGLSFEI